eukprot:2574202-Rhodomonas_salina.2
MHSECAGQGVRETCEIPTPDSHAAVGAMNVSIACGNDSTDARKGSKPRDALSVIIDSPFRSTHGIYGWQ